MNPHGTRRRYNAGYHCGKCREANAAYNREYRSRPETRERILEQARKWKRRNLAKVREHERQYVLRQRGSVREGILPVPVAPFYLFLEALEREAA